MSTSQSSLPSRMPMVEVETTVCGVSNPKLLTWLGDLRDGLTRVLSESPDGEAIHDLRVALRRIRSILRLVKDVYGAFYVDRIRADMKRVSDATSSLRDEEVLDETIAGLKLGEAERAEVKRWTTQRQEREATLRESVVRLLQSGALDAPMAHLGAIATLPCRPKRDREAKKFARRVVQRAQDKIEVLRSARVDDGVAMHDLRIAYKRLRYAVEAFSPVLPPELRAWGLVATKFQKVLGNLHDHDVALDVIAHTTSLQPSTQQAVIAALHRKREKLARQYIELVGPAFLNVGPVQPAAAKEPHPPEPAKKQVQEPSAPETTPAPAKAAQPPRKRTARRTSGSATRKRTTKPGKNDGPPAAASTKTRKRTNASPARKTATRRTTRKTTRSSNET